MANRSKLGVSLTYLSWDEREQFVRQLNPTNQIEMGNMRRCRIFLLSPAYAGGERARMILSDRAEFELARKLRGKRGAPIAEVFTFLSGLYFRGKIAYATAFARPATGTPGVFVITPTRGLVDARNADPSR